MDGKWNVSTLDEGILCHPLVFKRVAYPKPIETIIPCPPCCPNIIVYGFGQLPFSGLLMLFEALRQLFTSIFWHQAGYIGNLDDIYRE